MLTLIEIFDAKQYENIITPLSMENISKLIYVGSKEVMTKEKIQNLKRFFANRKFSVPIEFLYVERDNPHSILNRFTQISKNNPNCVFDATGGEDVILTSVGIIAGQLSLPVIRIDIKNGKCIVIHGDDGNLSFKTPLFSIEDFITLQGGNILRYSSVSDLTQEEAEDIKSLFSVNSNDCEAYSAFCNLISEFVTRDGKSIIINKEEFQKKAERTKYNVGKVLENLFKESLLHKIKEDDLTITCRVNSRAVALCLSKSGNALEYYTALTASKLTDKLTDVRVGVSIEWNDRKEYYETQNEIDVMAISNGLPMFISCKNGEVRKDALYELDTVARMLGGPYSKKVLVCTYISKNQGAREHFIRRAKDMGIKLVFNAHKKSPGEFTQFLKGASG